MKHRFKNHNYKWSGITASGKTITGELQATSIGTAKIELCQQGMTILSIRKQSIIARFFHIRQHTKIASPTEICAFYQQLATLIKAGIPLAQCFDILSKNQSQPSLNKLIHLLKIELDSGKSLASGLLKYPYYFDTLTCALIQIAEYSGTLDIMLGRIACHKEKTLALSNKIKQALFYPAILVLVALIITVVMLVCIVPRFAELFASFHHALPPCTLAIIKLSHFVQHDGWVFIMFAVIACLLIRYISYFSSAKNVIDKTILKLPMIKKFIFARFVQTLATMLSAGIPLTEALDKMTRLHKNHCFNLAMHQLCLDTRAGQRLHMAMSNNALFYPLMMQMVKVGEESGSLEIMLEKIAEFYDREVDYWAANMSQLLEPLIIMVLGVLIGGLVIAMYLPIFKLGTII